MVVLRSAEMRNFSAAECEESIRGNVRNVLHLIFRKLPLDNFPQCAFYKIAMPVPPAIPNHQLLITAPLAATSRTNYTHLSQSCYAMLHDCIPSTRLSSQSADCRCRRRLRQLLMHSMVRSKLPAPVTCRATATRSWTVLSAVIQYEGCCYRSNTVSFVLTAVGRDGRVETAMVNSPVEYNDMVKTDCVDLYLLVGTSWLRSPVV